MKLYCCKYENNRWGYDVFLVYAKDKDDASRKLNDLFGINRAEIMEVEFNEDGVFTCGWGG